MPAAAGKGVAKKPKPKQPPPKAPKPQVDKKIAAAAAPKPKPKLKLKLKLKLKKPPPKKPPPKTPKPKPKPKQPALRTSPIKAGEVKNYANVSVGNIVVPEAEVDVKPNKHWPAWAKRQTHKKIQRTIRIRIRNSKGAQNVDWKHLEGRMKIRFKKLFVE